MKKHKGSLTLEAALVLPIFLSLSISLISVLEMMNLYARVEYALHETAREISLMAYPASYVKNIGEEFLGADTDIELPDASILNPLLSETLVRAMFTENFGLGNLNDSMIKNGEAGIFFFRSEVINEKGDTDLIVTYKVEPLFNLFKVDGMTFANRVKVHSWTGYVPHSVDGEEEYVYITDNASVYHTNRNCSHLRLSINTVLLSDIENCRNKDGKKYGVCKKCAKDNNADTPQVVFITDYGESYHTSLSCSGLKRTVYKVKLSEVSGKKQCGRCASYISGKVEGDGEDDGSDQDY
jgi:hypothetical protein